MHKKKKLDRWERDRLRKAARKEKALRALNQAFRELWKAGWKHPDGKVNDDVTYAHDVIAGQVTRL